MSRPTNPESLHTLEVPQERTFSARDVAINYLDSPGGSSNPIVLLHGGAWCWEEYLSLIPSLSAQYSVYAPDLRGNGHSAWVPEHYRLRDFAEDQEQFLRWLGKPAVLVGHSIGGVIALMVARRCPELVRALIIEDAPIFTEKYRTLAASGLTMYEDWLRLKREARSESELAVLLAQVYGQYPGITSTWLLFFARCLWLLDPTFFHALIGDFEDFVAGYDGREILQELRCPILFIRGEVELGAVLSAEEEAWLRENYQSVQLAAISGVGHLLHLNDSGQAPVLQAMMAFLQSLPPLS